jgi:hypothetical protein
MDFPPLTSAPISKATHKFIVDTNITSIKQQHDKTVAITNHLARAKINCKCKICVQYRLDQLNISHALSAPIAPSVWKHIKVSPVVEQRPVLIRNDDAPLEDDEDFTNYDVDACEFFGCCCDNHCGKCGGITNGCVCADICFCCEC